MAMAAVGFVPFLVGRGQSKGGGWSAARVLPVCNAASAGVFLAAALMHLLCNQAGSRAGFSSRIHGQNCGRVSQD